MGIVKGSVVVATTTTGNYQITMPESDLDIIGFAPAGYVGGDPIYNAPPIVGVYLDASNIAYFPMPFNQNYTVRKYSPIHIKLKGTILNLNIPYFASGGLTVFYGVPDGNEVELETLKGVPFMYENTSTTANTTGTLSVTFPSGNVVIRGILVIGANGGIGEVNFITGTGNTLYLPFSSSPDPMDLPDNITPLDLKSATVLPLNYALNYTTTGTASVLGIIYYE